MGYHRSRGVPTDILRFLFSSIRKLMLLSFLEKGLLSLGKIVKKRGKTYATGSRIGDVYV